MAADLNEWIQVLDENGNETGKLKRREVVHKKGLWHNEVACVVINNKRQILLQKRSKDKQSYPGCWALFAGHVVAFDNIIDSIITEMRQESGSEVKEENMFLLIPKMKNVREDNNCYVTCYCTIMNKSEKDIEFQKSEIDEVKWFTLTEFRNMIKSESGTIFKDNEYYNKIIEELEKLFNSKDFYKKIDDLTEKLEELDRFGNPTGKIVAREFAHNFGIYHKGVSLFIVNDKNEILLQQRSKKKIRNAGLWDVSVSGHVRYGEDDISAILRECVEESKYELTAEDLKPLCKYKETRKFSEKFTNNEFYNVFVAHVNEENKSVNDYEVSKTKFFTVDELREMMQTYEKLTFKPKAYESIISYVEKLKSK